MPHDSFLTLGFVPSSGPFPMRSVNDRWDPIWTVASIPNLQGITIDTILDLAGSLPWAEIAELVGQGLTWQQVLDIYNELTHQGTDVTPLGKCFFPLKEDPVTGECKAFLGDQPGPDGVPVNGRYGTGMVPTTRNISRDVCPKGMVLGDDHICYNRRNISNKDRRWPKGTRPLGTAEEMRAVRIASRFAGRFERTTKRMQKIGLVKKPAAARRRAPKRIGPGPGITVIDTE